MRYLVNGQEADLRPDPGVKVTDIGDRLSVEGHGTGLVRRKGGKIYASYKGRTYIIEPLAAKAAQLGASNGEVHAPIPGAIVEVYVVVGQAVISGERLMVLEAMKMQQPMVAPFDGTIEIVAVSKGEQVSADALLAKVSPVEKAP